MAYVPQHAATLVPGIAGNDSAWQKLVDNLNALYATASTGGYAPLIAAGCMVADDGTIPSVTGTGSDPICAITVPKNADNQPLQLIVNGDVDSGDAARWTLTYDGGSSVASSSATGDNSYVTTTATPTGSGHPRTATVAVAGASAGDVVRTRSVLFRLLPTVAATGTEASGFVNPDATGMYQTGQPVTTERVARLLNGVAKLASDRPACIFTHVEYLGHTGARANMVASSDAWVLVAKVNLAMAHIEARTYRVSVFLTVDTSGSPVPACNVNLAGQQVSATAAGWTHGTVTLGGGTPVMTVKLKRSSGSNNVYLKTIQVIREP